MSQLIKKQYFSIPKKHYIILRVHAIKLGDFLREDFYLIGINSALEDYKVAYLLNKNLNIMLFKERKDLEFIDKSRKSYYSIYNYKSKVNDVEWFLISNIYKEKSKAKEDELLVDVETTSYLISKSKKTDFFIKVYGEVEYEFMNKTIFEINKIDHIIASYHIDKNTLKQKDFLIF